MESIEFFMLLAVGAVLLIGPIATLILALVAFFRSRKIDALMFRVAELERRISGPQESIPASPASVPPAAHLNRPEFFNKAHAERQAAGSPSQTGWESFIGQKAFGWLAVLLFVFASAFFLRYAYQNNWIGPVGRVTILELIGLALIGGGWWNFQRDLKLFSNMLTAAGIVVIYLATYSAFGFYQLIPQPRAGIFLSGLVLESMILAVLYRSLIVALVAVIGGLLTPMLMASDIDDYSALFLYLAILNAGVVIACWLRNWTVVSWVAYLGTQGLFGLWYESNYHPDKFGWTLGFQVVLFSLYLLHTLSASRYSLRLLSQSELVLFVLNPITAFLIFRLLLQDRYGNWLGSLALAMATIYAIVAHIGLSRSVRDSRFGLTSIAVSVGFLASALPLQAQADWIALGWAAMGAVLAWFGWRISTPLLRMLAGLLAVFAVSRLMMYDLPFYVRDPFIPIFNRQALPSLGVAICILAGVILSDPYWKRLSQMEQYLIAIVAIIGILLLWLILSLECYGYFLSQSIGDSSVSIEIWRWRGQLGLTIFWAAFATAVLVLGFQLNRARLRWVAIAIYAAAVAKVFIIDMANVHQIYRILVFFILAVVLGLVARAYQRFHGATQA